MNTLVNWLIASKERGAWKRRGMSDEVLWWWGRWEG